MRITAIEEYGLRCLMRVVEHTREDPISAREVAEKEGLSIPYTQKILRILSDHDLVESKRGSKGGYYFEESTEEVSLGEVLGALDGFIEIETFCSEYTGNLDICTHQCECSIRPIWTHLSDLINEILEQVSLEVLRGSEVDVRQFLGNQIEITGDVADSEVESTKGEFAVQVESSRE